MPEPTILIRKRGDERLLRRRAAEEPVKLRVCRDCRRAHADSEPHAATST